jgi:hypothetical protein
MTQEALVVGRAPWPAAGPLAGSLPRTRPPVILRHRDQSRPHRIRLDVPANPLHLLSIPYHVIVTLLLPEGLAGQPQNLVGPLGGDALQRPQQSGNLDLRSNQQVEVIGHDDIGMKHIVPEQVLAVLQGIDDDLSDPRLSQIQGTGSSLVEQPVHRDEGSPGGDAGVGEGSVGGQAPVQSPCHKQRPADGVPMWESPPVVVHAESVSRTSPSRPGGRLRPRGAAPLRVSRC